MPAVYTVTTNLPPEAVSAIALEIYRLWVDFAMGGADIGGQRIVHPTGKYAAAIRMERRGPSEVAVLVDDRNPPEAGIIESGHEEVDLKLKLQRHKAYRMHRTPGWMGGRPAPGLLREGGALKGVYPTVWRAARALEATGFASIGDDSDPNSWIIPAMPAYRPAAHLYALALQMAEEAKP